MKELKLQELSNEGLLKREKITILVTYTLIGMLIVLFALGLFLTFTENFSTLTVVPITLMPIVVINLGNLKKIKAERRIRNL